MELGRGGCEKTRIIIVSDHGYYMNQFDDMRFGKRDIMAYNPLLMIKNLDSQEFTTDYTFMTNGDVPTLATKNQNIFDMDNWTELGKK